MSMLTYYKDVWVMKLLISVIFFLSCTLVSFAQTSKVNELQNLVTLDFSFQGLGLTFEPHIGNKAVVDLSAGVGGGYDIAEGHLDYILDLLHPSFYFSATPKFYYNRKERMSADKNANYNSGNYIGLRVKYVTAGISDDDQTRNSLLVNLHWGLQRAIGTRFALNALLGAGYAQDLENRFGTVYPSFDFKFSYILSKTKM